MVCVYPGELTRRCARACCGCDAGDWADCRRFTYPTAITISGQTAIVVQPYNDTVSLINTKSAKLYPPIPVGEFPAAVTVTG